MRRLLVFVGGAIAAGALAACAVVSGLSTYGAGDCAAECDASVQSDGGFARTDAATDRGSPGSEASIDARAAEAGRGGRDASALDGAVPPAAPE